MLFSVFLAGSSIFVAYYVARLIISEMNAFYFSINVMKGIYAESAIDNKRKALLSVKPLLRSFLSMLFTFVVVEAVFMLAIGLMKISALQAVSMGMHYASAIITVIITFGMYFFIDKIQLQDQ